MAKIKLICLPFAGGSCYSYNSFDNFITNGAEIKTIEPPGRGMRYSEPLLSNIGDLANDYLNQIKKLEFDKYALYGHSVGALTGYMLIKKIIENNLKLPLHFFVSGMNSPSARLNHKTLHLYPKNELFAKIKEYGGTPDLVFEDETLTDFLEPFVRADFKAYETFEYVKSEPFNVPITVFYADKDMNTSLVHLPGWKNETKSVFEMVEYKGGHFFIFEHAKDMIGRICGKLTEYE